MGSGDGNAWKPNEEDRREMERLGVPREQIERDGRSQAAADEEPAVCIAPHLAAVVDLFANLRSQWRTASAGMGGFLYAGLDYSAIEPTKRLMGLSALTPADQAREFAWLRVMEMEARTAMNER